MTKLRNEKLETMLGHVNHHPNTKERQSKENHEVRRFRGIAHFSSLLGLDLEPVRFPSLPDRTATLVAVAMAVRRASP